MVVNCLYVINCTAKWLLALIPALLISQLAQSRHTKKKKKSMFSSWSGCMKSADMQGWGKLAGSCCQLCCVCLNEDQDLAEKKGRVLLLLVLLGEHHCPAWLEILLCPADFLILWLGLFLSHLRLWKPLLMDYYFIPWPITDCSHSPRYLLG